jgi:hypothetical protein
MNPFATLLDDLSPQLGIPLFPDKLGACKLNFNHVLDIQLEYESRKDQVLIASFLSDVPPGKFRENTLKDALKANYPFPTHGTLAFSDRNNKLTLFATFHISSLTGAKLADFLSLFKEKAMLWKKAVESGNTASLVPQAKKLESNPFGLK